MQVKRSSAVPATGSAGSESLRVVAGVSLSYGDLAWAVCLSDMPTARPQGAAEDALAYAVRGLDRVGPQGLARLGAESRRLVQEKYFGPTKAAKRDASLAHSRLWGGARRFDRAHSLAGRLWHTLPLVENAARELAAVA